GIDMVPQLSHKYSVSFSVQFLARPITKTPNYSSFATIVIALFIFLSFFLTTAHIAKLCFISCKG
ncbi:MAG: hypothetical protein RSC30_07440, partial [Oscillospiraceae bacterium]